MSSIWIWKVCSLMSVEKAATKSCLVMYSLLPLSKCLNIYQISGWVTRLTKSFTIIENSPMLIRPLVTSLLYLSKMKSGLPLPLMMKVEIRFKSCQLFSCENFWISSAYSMDPLLLTSIDLNNDIISSSSNLISINISFCLNSLNLRLLSELLSIIAKITPRLKS